MSGIVKSNQSESKLPSKVVLSVFSGLIEIKQAFNLAALIVGSILFLALFGFFSSLLAAIIILITTGFYEVDKEDKRGTLNLYFSQKIRKSPAWVKFGKFFS